LAAESEPSVLSVSGRTKAVRGEATGSGREPVADREATIRHHALFERAENYEAQGKKAVARKDLERILSEDSDYPGVREKLAS